MFEKNKNQSEWAKADRKRFNAWKPAYVAISSVAPLCLPPTQNQEENKENAEWEGSSRVTKKKKKINEMAF